MTTLATINGEALAVPGLRFWGNRAYGRIAIICSDEHGAIELWTEELWMNSPDPLLRRLGGVETHRTTPHRWDPTGEPDFTDCAIVSGGRCWTDGSGLAYSEQFLPMIERGDHRGVLQALADRHRADFGGAR